MIQVNDAVHRHRLSRDAMLHVRLLCTEDAALSLPLARLGQPDISVQRWTETIAGSGGGASGVLCAFTGREPRAMLVYRTMDDLCRGRILMVESIVAFDLLDPHALATMLVDEAARRCPGHDAIAFVVDITERQVWGGLVAEAAVLNRVF